MHHTPPDSPGTGSSQKSRYCRWMNVEKPRGVGGLKPRGLILQCAGPGRYRIFFNNHLESLHPSIRRRRKVKEAENERTDENQMADRR